MTPIFSFFQFQLTYVFYVLLRELHPCVCIYCRFLYIWATIDLVIDIGNKMLYVDRENDDYDTLTLRCRRLRRLSFDWPLSIEKNRFARWRLTEIVFNPEIRRRH